MQQQEIQFFWPLTEQIPLALDYTDCDKPKLWTTNSYSITPGSYLAINNGGTAWSTIAAATPTFEIRKEPNSVGSWQLYEGLNVHRPEKPKYFVRLFTKLLLGWKWIDK
jgi:hypothetical protein